MPASIDTSAVPTPICLLPFLMSSTLPRNESCGCLPCAVGLSCGPPGHAVSAFCAESPMQAMVVELPLLEPLPDAALLDDPDDPAEPCDGVSASADPVAAKASARHIEKKNATRFITLTSRTST